MFITRKWPPAVGGMETYAFELSRELGKITLLEVSSLPGKLNGAPPSAVQLGWFFLSNLFSLGFKRTYDVYHIGDMVLWPLAVVARVFKPKSKTAITAYGLDLLYGYREGLAPKIYRSYIKLAAKLLNEKTTIIAISRATAELCVTAGFKSVEVVPLGTAHQAKPFERKKAKPYVLFVGRLVKRKGAGWFAKNVMPLLPSHIEMKVAGPKWDAEEEAALNASDRVEYLGLVSNDELTRLRQNAIAVLMPNISMGVKDFEGFGLTAPEAAAEGGVLIAAAVEGVTDAVIDSETGFLMPEETPEAWVAKILEIEKWSASQRKSFIERSQKSVKENYSWAKVAENTLRAYGK